mgnify:CR=1 FL=1
MQALSCGTTATRNLKFLTRDLQQSQLTKTHRVKPSKEEVNLVLLCALFRQFVLVRL